MADASSENVADLIARPPEEYVAEPRYVSKYREIVRRAAKRGKSAHKTLGVPSVNLNPPTQYLKKNSKELPKRPEVHHKHYHIPGYQHKLPDWQPIKAADREAQVTQNQSVDFTKRNIDEAKNLRPHTARKYYVDDRRGTTHNLRTSGLFPLYRNKKNYGQVPGVNSLAAGIKLGELNAKNAHKRDKIRGKNRDRSNEETEDTKAERNDLKLEINSTKSAESSIKKNSYNSYKEKDEGSIISSHPRQPRCRYVTEDERAELLYDCYTHERDNGMFPWEIFLRQFISWIKDENGELKNCGDAVWPFAFFIQKGMKKKWDEMMKQFQCLPFLTDTPPKAKRKSKMEKDLNQLEKDIEVIERHPYIYVYNDDAEEDS